MAPPDLLRYTGEQLKAHMPVEEYLLPGQFRQTVARLVNKGGMYGAEPHLRAMFARFLEVQGVDTMAIWLETGIVGADCHSKVLHSYNVVGVHLFCGEGADWEGVASIPDEMCQNLTPDPNALIVEPFFHRADEIGHRDAAVYLKERMFIDGEAVRRHAWSFGQPGSMSDHLLVVARKEN